MSDRNEPIFHGIAALAATHARMRAQREADKLAEQAARSRNSGAGLPDVACTCALCQEAPAAAASHARAVAAPPGRSIFDAISWDEVAKAPTAAKIEAPFEGIDFEKPKTFHGRMKDGRPVLIHHVDLRDKWPAVDDRGLMFEAYTSAFRSNLDGEEGPWAFSHVDRIAAEASGDPLKFRGDQDMLFLSNAGVDVGSIECVGSGEKLLEALDREALHRWHNKRTPLPPPHWRPQLDQDILATSVRLAAQEYKRNHRPPLHRRVWAAIGRWHARMMGGCEIHDQEGVVTHIAVIGSPERFRVWQQENRRDAVNITRIDQLRSARNDEVVYLPGWWLSVDPEINRDEVAARMVGRV